MKLLWLVLALLASFVGGFVLAGVIYKLSPLPGAGDFLYLLLAGGAGGLAQALLLNRDRLRPPAWVTV